MHTKYIYRASPDSPSPAPSGASSVYGEIHTLDIIHEQESRDNEDNQSILKSY